MKIRILTYLTILVIVTLDIQFCQSQELVLGAQSSSLNYSSVSVINYWANNQANMVNYKSTGIAFYYENKFMMNQLGTKAITLFTPAAGGVLGAKYRYFGYELFNDQLIGIYYARNILHRMSIGVQLDIQIQSIAENENIITPTFEIGICTDLNNNISFGLWTYNPIGVKVKGNLKPLTIIRTGLRWDISTSVFTTIEAEKDTRINEITLRAGAEYNISKRYFFRIGVSTCENSFSFGVGFYYHNLSFNVSSVMHSLLGVSMQFGLNYSFKRK